MFHYTVETGKSMDEAIQSLEVSLKEEKFGVLWQFDIEETLKKKGFNFEQPYKILEVCNPKVANSILTENQLIGYFLPCKIVVYQDAETKKTKMGLPKPTALIEMINEESLMDIATEIENRLISCIDKSV
ncbi:DUF302 domain-containing protein [Oceanobacillus massiliensis]|uniref:DUF302 domain-containing protein n=1 Tax=Oceanobacillus massiliensis TaxID=1465765 RepID=UPI00301664A0